MRRDLHQQIHARAAGLQLAHREPEPRHLDAGQRVRLLDEEGLHQRRGGEVARRRQLGDQPLEGQLLEGQGAEQRAVDTPDQLVDGRVRRDGQPQHQGVGEAADHFLELAPLPAADRHAHAHVGLAGEPA